MSNKSIVPKPRLDPVISLRGVSKRYANGALALEEIDLEVDRGDFLFLVGPSGAGKSTIVRLLVREEKATSGQVFVNGVDLGRLRRHQLPALRRQVGLVFQDFKLLPRLTVYENVAFALRVHGESGRRTRDRVRDALETVGLQKAQRRYPHEMSGGEQQRVGIARALVHAPQLLVADEPTGNVDPATSWELMQLFLGINAAGATVVMATHNRDIVDVLRRRVVAIDHGRIVRDDLTGRYHDTLPASALRA
jgi:cell division transport system ATP-binding protein